MRILLVLAILVTVSLLAASKAMYALRRTRWGAAVTSGGWVLMGVGFALGPFGARLIGEAEVAAIEPLVLFCLGWIGLIVGLQVHRKLPTVLPLSVQRVTGVDLILSVTMVGAVTWAIVGGSSGQWEVAIAPAMLLGVCAAGWSPETRSLRAGGVRSHAAVLVQASSGLATIAAVLGYGLFVGTLTIIEGPEGNVLGFSWGRLVTGVGMMVTIALTMGLMGTWLMGLAGKGPGEFLVILLGLVTFMAGAALVMGYSPLLTSMLAGSVMVNLPGKSLSRFKRVIMEAEQPMAMSLMAIAGLLLDPRIGWRGLVLVGVLLVVRVIVKQWMIRPLALRLVSMEQSTPSIAGLVRQSPIAIAIAVGFAVSPFGSEGIAGMDGQKLLAVVVMMALISDLLALMQTTPPRRNPGAVAADRGPA